MVIKSDNVKEIYENLLKGKLVILPTDTIYGIHCLASREDLVEKVREIKQKEQNMPMITLVSKKSDLSDFGIEIGETELAAIGKYWPGPNTLIFNTKEGTTRSFRLPKNDFLISIIDKTGPLISTSANLHGQPHSRNIKTALEYFGDKVDVYVDGGELNNTPSSIYKLEGGEIVKIR
jgi:L-threonylcarbamoyladenylate synthase